MACMSLTPREARIAGYNGASGNTTAPPRAALPRAALGSPLQPSGQQFHPVRAAWAPGIEQITDSGICNITLRRQVGSYSARKRGPLVFLNSGSWLPPMISRVDPGVPERQCHSKIDQ